MTLFFVQHAAWWYARYHWRFYLPLAAFLCLWLPALAIGRML